MGGYTSAVIQFRSGAAFTSHRYGQIVVAKRAGFKGVHRKPKAEPRQDAPERWMKRMSAKPLDSRVSVEVLQPPSVSEPPRH
jgi:hypothetical protein